MPTFKIIPILGLRTDLPTDDKRLFQPVSENVVLCHCVDGENFDLMRQPGSVTKSYGYLKWSNTATAQATKCLGIFELYDGTNRNRIFCDNGKVYAYDANKDPADVSGAVTLATGNTDIYSMVQVGSHIVIADRAETTPYSWKHGDAAIGKAISSGTEYKFRYLSYFAQRMIGAYSDQTNGDIDIRWSGVIPVPGTTCVFGAANQIYVPNDDPITGLAKMGENNLFVLCENSIQQLVHYQSNLTPFQSYTIVMDQGCAAPHSVVALSDRIYFFNRNYGFCEYRGGNQFPFGGNPISQPIDSLISGVSQTYSDTIVGKFIPWRKQIIWGVPSGSSETPNHIYVYDILTGSWTIKDIAARYLGIWNLDLYSTIAELETAFGTNLADLDPDNHTFSYYGRLGSHVVFGNTDGQAYLHETESYASASFTAYRTEPVIDFGNPRRSDLLTEIWFDFVSSEDLNITIYWRGGDTLGELAAQSFQSIGTISHSSPSHPFLPTSKNARLHQIKWESTTTVKFQVNGITFKFSPGSER